MLIPGKLYYIWETKSENPEKLQCELWGGDAGPFLGDLPIDCPVMIVSCENRYSYMVYTIQFYSIETSSVRIAEIAAYHNDNYGLNALIEAEPCY